VGEILKIPLKIKREYKNQREERINLQSLTFAIQQASRLAPQNDTRKKEQEARIMKSEVKSRLIQNNKGAVGAF
jgi:hypothetical protein